MNAKRTEPRVHAFRRPIDGDYVNSASTTPEHMRAVFDAERERLAQAAAPRRRRRKAAVVTLAIEAPTETPAQAQLQLVA